MDMKKALLKAPHHQGGHSDVGRKLAKQIGIPFPIRMQPLALRAEQLGFDPAELYPWYDNPN